MCRTIKSKYKSLTGKASIRMKLKNNEPAQEEEQETSVMPVPEQSAEAG